MQLIAEELNLERGSRLIIDSLSFAAQAGEALILTGPNGAGKTTLLRAIAGFLKPASGSIRLEGSNPELSIGEQSHFIGHANAVKANLTVAENVRFWASYLGEEPGAEERETVALALFGLADLAGFPAAYLSAGQRRRLGLARLVAANRPLWLLDEPTVSLDASATALLAKAVNAHLVTGGLVIAASHLPLGFSPARERALSRLRAAA